MAKNYIEIPLTVYDVRFIRYNVLNSSVGDRFYRIFSCGHIRIGTHEDTELCTNQIIIEPVTSDNKDLSSKVAKSYALTEVKLYLPDSSDTTDKFVSEQEARFFLIYSGKDDGKETFDLIVWDSEMNPVLNVMLKSK